MVRFHSSVRFSFHLCKTGRDDDDDDFSNNSSSNFLCCHQTSKPFQRLSKRNCFHQWKDEEEMNNCSYFIDARQRTGGATTTSLHFTFVSTNSVFITSQKRVMSTQTDGWCLRQSFLHVLRVNASAVRFAAAAAELKKTPRF